MGALIKTDKEYKDWIIELKQRIRQSQIKAAIKVNTELIRMYWDLGKDIVEKQSESKWGSGFFNELSQDLKDAFPNMQGFSKRNLELIKKWYLFYNKKDTIAKQLVSQLQSAIYQVPWGHHIKIVTKCTTVQEVQFYIYKTIENGWSRNVLLNMIESGLYHREGNSINNFSLRLPTAQSNLAHELTKDPYNFDFLALREGYAERELEEALVSNISKFLLELGNGFAYMGHQVPITVGGQEFRIDMLFYNIHLRAYVVIELKAGDFEPEFISKLGFYVSAVNHELCKEGDNPTIGLLVCKSKNEIVARYTLESTILPIGISEYELNKLYPKDFKSTLPSIEDIENELKD
ncbi:MAG: PDDEXK nuclease domain-containing protein [Bacteroides sp.]|nr:PDDEXK nuclease domain-containing protein [Bacteroides sp.]